MLCLTLRRLLPLCTIYHQCIKWWCIHPPLPRRPCCIHRPSSHFLLIAADGSSGGVHCLLQRQVQGQAQAVLAAHPGSLCRQGVLSSRECSRSPCLARLHALLVHDYGYDSDHDLPVFCMCRRAGRSLLCRSSKPPSSCYSTRKVSAGGGFCPCLLSALPSVERACVVRRAV